MGDRRSRPLQRRIEVDVLPVARSINASTQQAIFLFPVDF
jgi:hypothetical protein